VLLPGKDIGPIIEEPARDDGGIRTLGLAERTGAFRNGRPVAVMALQGKQLAEALLKPGPPRVELTRG